MPNARGVLCAVVGAISLACGDGRAPTAPLEPKLSPALGSVPLSGLTGVDGFHFTPPIGSGPAPAADLDGSLLDLLAVEICKWTGTACVQPLVRRITSQTESPEQLRLTETSIYRALWKTEKDGLDPERTYRIRILASGGELGHVDVDVVASGKDALGGPTEPVRLTRGSTLSIGFVIEQGLGERVGSQGGTVELADGVVTLDLPPGALTQDIFITAVPATDLPPGLPPVVPGTAWDFGPDGLVFAHPIVMTIRYDPAQLPPGVVESELRIHKLVNGSFEQQDAGLVDLVNHTVSAEVDGFSVFVVFPRDPLNPEDIEAPVVRALEVLDPATGTFGNAITLDVSGADAVLTTRIHITDNITGVGLIDIRWSSPTGRQLRFPCFTGAPPDEDSDTNGKWICQAIFPQHAEGGTWRAQFIAIRDKINNSAFYFQGPGGFCEQTGTSCINLPQITVTSASPDLDPPVVQSLGVSLDVQPRMFGPSVSVDASMGARVVFFGLQVTDNLSGVGNWLFFDFPRLDFTGPSNQTQVHGSCNLTQGTNLNGFWECFVLVPAQAETGTWRLTFMRVADRAGNGGFSGFSDFRPNAFGQLCNPGGNCVTSPTVEVTSLGDGEPPALQSVNITTIGADVTTSLGLTDNTSGVSHVRVRYTSTLTSQFQECIGILVAGSATNGTWDCTITFSQFAARGQWVLSVQVFDVAGNNRFYFRRASDGFLCYFDQATSMQICQNFGVTDIVLLL